MTIGGIAMTQPGYAVIAYALGFLAVAIVVWLTLAAGVAGPGANPAGLGGPDLLRVLI